MRKDVEGGGCGRIYSPDIRKLTLDIENSHENLSQDSGTSGQGSNETPQ
jgi:hypothetical protein